MSDHYWITRLGVEGFLCGPNLAHCESGGLKRMQRKARWSDWPDRVMFHTTWITLGAVELAVLYAFVCQVGYFDAEIRKPLLYKSEV